MGLLSTRLVRRIQVLDLSKIVDSDSRQMVGQLTATLQDLLDTLTRPHARGLADFNEDLCRRPSVLAIGSPQRVPRRAPSAVVRFTLMRSCVAAGLVGEAITELSPAQRWAESN